MNLLRKKTDPVLAYCPLQIVYCQLSTDFFRISQPDFLQYLLFCIFADSPAVITGRYPIAVNKRSKPRIVELIKLQIHGPEYTFRHYWRNRFDHWHYSG